MRRRAASLRPTGSPPASHRNGIRRLRPAAKNAPRFDDPSIVIRPPHRIPLARRPAMQVRDARHGSRTQETTKFTLAALAGGGLLGDYSCQARRQRNRHRSPDHQLRGGARAARQRRQHRVEVSLSLRADGAPWRDPLEVQPREERASRAHEQGGDRADPEESRVVVQCRITYQYDGETTIAPNTTA